MASVIASTAVDTVVLISAIGPVVVVLIIIWVFFRAARRNDEREAQEAARLRPPQSGS
jgi:hypothetical protein